MATTISSYKVDLLMDASRYIRESSLSRTETALLKREINAARTPAENFARSVDRIREAQRKGAIDIATMNRLLESQVDKLNRANGAAVTMSSTIKDTILNFAKMYIGIQSVTRALGVLKTRMQEIDQTAKAARGIGEDTNRLQKFQFALSEIAGIEGEAAITHLERLEKAVGEASLGIGTAGENFKRLGLDITELRNMAPVEQFETLAKAIRAVRNPTEQAAFATQIFGRSGVELLPILKSSAAAYEDATSQINKLGLAVTEIDVQRIEATNDAMGRVQASIKGLTQSIAGTGGLSDALNTVATIVSKLGALSDLGRFVGNPDVEKFKSILDRLGLTPMLPKEQEMMPIPGLRPKPKPGRLGPERETFGPTVFGGGGDAGLGALIDKGFAALKGSGGNLAAVMGAISQSAGMIAMQGMANTEQLITSMQQDPAIASLELGTQEAYTYLTQATRDAEHQAAIDAANQKILEENAAKSREKMVGWLETINESLSDFGLKRFR